MGRKGFFSIDDLEGRVDIIKPDPVPRRKRAIEKLLEGGEPNCAKCGLFKGCISPKMSYTGQGKKKILIIAEAPGKTEDELNTQLVGEAGRFFADKLEKVGIDLHQDCWKINSVNCRPAGNKKPTDVQISACRPYVMSVVKELKPKLIILAGEVAVKFLYKDRFKDLTISRWESLVFYDPRIECWVYPIFHPSYAVRNETDENLQNYYLRSLSKIPEILKREKRVIPNYEEKVHFLLKKEEVVEFLKRVLKEKPSFAFDYEATGIKPYNKGHRIICCSISFSGESWAFPLQKLGYWDKKDQQEIERLFVQIINDPLIEMTAQNILMEDSWSKVILGAKPEGWVWDTMVMSHLIDTRKKFTGLKFQVFYRFSVEGYEDETKPYLPEGKEFNLLEQMPLDRLLLYNGLDSLFTDMLADIQIKELAGNDLLLDLYHDGNINLTNMAIEGVPIKKEMYEKHNVVLGNRLERITRNIQESPEGKEFKRRTGQLLNVGSPDQLNIFLFDICKLPPPSKKTQKGYSTDANVLADLNHHPLVKQILLHKKLVKIKGTYLSQFLNLSYEDEKLHPTFALFTARSGRSSSFEPNFQNIPVHEEEAKIICRSGIVAPEGYRLIENDYGSMEVRIIACYSEDRTLVAYVHDTSTDMHRDEAMNLFMLPAKEVSKPIRYCAKNGWVFPEFYTAWYASCAQNLWKSVYEANLETVSGIPMQEWMASVGIGHYEMFEAHLKKYERVFWSRYPGVKKWQNKMVESYLAKGYLENLFGFRRTGYISRSECCNTPVQGTAFHCLLWAINRVRPQLPERIKSIGQIHDSYLNLSLAQDQSEVVRLVEKVGTQDIRKEFKWIIVPLSIETEFTPLGGSWVDKKEVKLKDGKWQDKDGKVYDENF